MYSDLESPGTVVRRRWWAGDHLRNPTTGEWDRRRIAYAGLAAAGCLAVIAALAVGLSSSGSASTASLLATGSADAEAATETCAACTLAEEATEGPYYVDYQLFRTNITEGQAGLPLTLQIKVVDTGCNPVEGAFVDIWHCNATGVYSSYTSKGAGAGAGGGPGGGWFGKSSDYKPGAASTTDDTTFLRGLVPTNSGGWALMETVYPGFYQGRAVHIHGKVHISSSASDDEETQYADSHVAHTGQIFLNDTLSSQIFDAAPYNASTATRTWNSQDGIYKSGGGSAQIACTAWRDPSDPAAGLVATIEWSLDPTATPSSVHRRKLLEAQRQEP